MHGRSVDRNPCSIEKQIMLKHVFVAQHATNLVLRLSFRFVHQFRPSVLLEPFENLKGNSFRKSLVATTAYFFCSF